MNGMASTDLAPAFITPFPAPAAGSAQGRGAQQDSAGTADEGSFANVLGDVLGSGQALTAAATGIGTPGPLDTAEVTAEPPVDGDSAAVPAGADPAQFVPAHFVPVAALPAPTDVPAPSFATGPAAVPAAASTLGTTAPNLTPRLPRAGHYAALAEHTSEQPAGLPTDGKQDVPAAPPANPTAPAAAVPGLATFVPAGPGLPDSRLTRAGAALAGNTQPATATTPATAPATQTPAAQPAGVSSTSAPTVPPMPAPSASVMASVTGAPPTGQSPIAAPLAAPATLGQPAAAASSATTTIAPQPGPVAPATPATTSPTSVTPTTAQPATTRAATVQAAAAQPAAAGPGMLQTPSARPGNTAPAGSPAAAVNGSVPVIDAGLLGTGTPADTSGAAPTLTQPAAAAPASGGAAATSATVAGVEVPATASGVDPSVSASSSSPAAPAAVTASADTLAAAGVSVAQQIPAPAQPGSVAAAPAPAAHAPPAPTLQPQLARPLFTLAGAPHGQHIMTLQVTPEDLGPLTVRAQIDATGVRIELFAPGDVGREAIRGILPELRKELADSGFGASVDVSDRSGPAGSSQDGTGRDSTGRDAGQDGSRGSRGGSSPGGGKAADEQRSGHHWDALADEAAVRTARTLNGPQTTLDILV
jgi:flagellar hook-length control protein FliK